MSGLDKLLKKLHKTDIVIAYSIDLDCLKNFC